MINFQAMQDLHQIRQIEITLDNGERRVITYKEWAGLGDPTAYFYNDVTAGDSLFVIRNDNGTHVSQLAFMEKAEHVHAD